MPLERFCLQQANDAIGETEAGDKGKGSLLFPECQMGTDANQAGQLNQPEQGLPVQDQGQASQVEEITRPNPDGPTLC